MIEKPFYKNPILISTIVCVLLLYSRCMPISRNISMYSGIERSEISFVKGRLVSNPVKSSNGMYFAKLSVQNVENKFGVKSSALGNLDILIPAEIVESYFPGKLFSISKGRGDLLCEEGVIILAGGKMNSRGVFVVDKVVNHYWHNSILGKIFYIRALSRMHFRRLMYAWKDAGGFLLALLSGSREYTDSKLSSSFRKAGLSHILALSGLHLSLMTNFSHFLTKKIGKKLEHFFHLFAILIFVWFAGFSPSLLRAFICSLTIFIMSLFSIKNVDMLSVLGFSFLLQIVISPNDVFNIAFMLSYGALAGILLFSNFFKRKLISFLPPYIASSFSASSSAQIFTAPISLSIFGTFMPIGIIATLVVSPLVTLFIYSGLLLIVLCLVFPMFNQVASLLMNSLYLIIKLCANFFSNFPGVSL